MIKIGFGVLLRNAITLKGKQTNLFSAFFIAITGVLIFLCRYFNNFLSYWQWSELY